MRLRDQNLTMVRASAVTPMADGALINCDYSKLSEQYKIAKSMAILDEPGKGIDSERMSATALINTDAVDYERAVILAGGTRTGNYSGNPTVLWEHGLNPDVKYPIASSNDGGRDLLKGQLHIDVSDYEISATSFFSRSYTEATQIFGLIDEGIIRATSIQVIPSKKSIYQMPDGSHVEVTEENDMVEWSWCCLGVNPEALRKSFGSVSERYERAWSLQADCALAVLDRGSVGTDRLSVGIRKSLLDLVPDRKPTLPGFDFDTDSEEMSKKTITAAQAKSLSLADLKKIVTDGNQLAAYDEKSQPLLKSLYDEKAKDEATEDEESDEEAKKKAADAKKKEADDAAGNGNETDGSESPEPEKKMVHTDDMKPVARAMVHFHRTLSAVRDTFTDRFENKLDHTPVTRSMLATIQAIESEMATVEGAFTDNYPEYPALTASDDEIQVDESFETQMKSLLSTEQRSHFQAKGVIGRLRDVVESDSLSNKDRASVRMALNAMDRLSTEAKSFTPAAPADMVSKADHESKVAEVVAERDSAIEQLTELNELIEKEILPAT